MRKAVVLDKSGTIINPCRVILEVGSGKLLYHLSTLKYVVERGETLVNIRGPLKALLDGRLDRISLKVSCCASKFLPKLDKGRLADPVIAEGLRRVLEQGKSHCSSQMGACAALIMNDTGEITHLVGLGGRLYDEVKGVVESFHEEGTDAFLATGNCREMTFKCADLLGVPHQFTIFDASPEDKKDLVRRLRGFYGVVVMVGNDINDLTAMREADIAIVVRRSGTSPDDGLEGCRDVDYKVPSLKEVEEIVSSIT